jgi:hypothetical protein
MFPWRVDDTAGIGPARVGARIEPGRDVLPIEASQQTLRRLLLALVVLGSAGLIPELLLLKHYESVWQLVPLVILALTLVVSVFVWRRPDPRSLMAFRVVMGLCVLAGIAGLVLHAKGNLEWALERDDTLHGWPLVWKILRGATPLLAPGAMAQLGLLGLIYTYHHPALERGPHLEPETT